MLNLPLTAGVPDPYTPSDGTWNVTGDVTVTGTVTAAAFTATGLTQGSVAFAGASGALTQDNANFFWDDTNNRLGIGTAAPGATLTVTQPAAASGAALALILTGGAHTGQTASTEVLDVDLAFNRTVTHATGALATQRQILVRQATHAFAAASTITNAYTLYIAGAPIAGTNATITNRWGAYLGGATQIGGHIIPDTDAAYDLGVSATTRIANIYVYGSISWDQGNGATITGTAITQKVDFNTYSVRGGCAAGSTNIDVIVGGASAITRTAGNLFQVINNASGTLTVAFDGGTAITTIAQSSGLRAAWTVTTAAHTGQTATFEASDVYYNLSATKTWATGAITTQRAFRIDAPTYAFNAASTITTAATFYISGAPIAGTNATITTGHALWVDGGTSRFDGQILVDNGTAAAPGYAFQGASNAGMYWGGTELYIAVGGTDIGRFQSNGWIMLAAGGGIYANLFAGLSGNATIVTMAMAQEFQEQSADAAAPAANYVRVYARDNGAGKTQYVARFATGAVQVMATEP